MARIGHFADARAEERFDIAHTAAMNQWPPHETLDVPTSFGSTRVYRHDHDGGTPVVLLHGACATSAMWAPTVAALHGPAYAVDILGDVGGSAQTKPLPDMNTWLREVLAALGTPKVVLVGSSYGGWVAALHAAKHPDQVAGLVLVEPAAGALAPYRFRVVLYALLAKASRSEHAWRGYLRWIAGGAEPSDAMTIGITHWRTGIRLPRRISDDVLRRVTAPTLLVVGEQSLAQDPHKVVERARRLMPNVTAVVVPGGHALATGVTGLIAAHAR